MRTVNWVCPGQTPHTHSMIVIIHRSWLVLPVMAMRILSINFQEKKRLTLVYILKSVWNISFPGRLILVWRLAGILVAILITYLKDAMLVFIRPMWYCLEKMVTPWVKIPHLPGELEDSIKCLSVWSIKHVL